MEPLLEQRRQHDRRTRVHCEFGPAQVAQDRLHALEIGRDDFEDVAVVAANVMAPSNAGMFSFAPGSSPT